MRTLEERFWEKVDKKGPEECWIWTGAKTRGGYGNMRAEGKTRRAHRIVWTLFNGEIPEGVGSHGTCVLHKCDVPACVNPLHLFLGTNADNVRDMLKKGRGCKGDSHPARTHPENMSRGEQRWNSKLTEKDILEIRKMAGTQDYVARKFGVARATIGDIKTRRTWAHVEQVAA